jgi:hypothetical protein
MVEVWLMMILHTADPGWHHRPEFINYVFLSEEDCKKNIPNSRLGDGMVCEKFSTGRLAD